jgi:hypothetical protein
MATVDCTHRRIDLLRNVLTRLTATERSLRIISFADEPRELPPSLAGWVPEPSGGTAMHLGLSHVATLRPRPGRAIVISDGAPDDARLALLAARGLRPMVIDCYFVGPESDRAALGFMRALSLAGGRPGLTALRSLQRPETLAAEIHLLLAGPSS